MNRMPDPADSLTSAAPDTLGVTSRPAGTQAAYAARTAATAAPAGRGAGAADGTTDTGRTAIGVAGGAAAGTMAGLQAGALAGAVTLGVGAVAGAVMGAAAGAALAQDADPSRYTTEQDAYYRALYEGTYSGNDESADVASGYDAARPAYVFGHVAASEPALAGHTFEEAEPALERAWNDELRPRAAGAATWAGVRRHVRDAYGHARAEGVGERRTPGVVGSGGSAVDPVELDRALHGLPSAGA